MDISLQKFNSLPKELRDKMSTSEFLSVIDSLEAKYNLKLALPFIKLVVADLVITDFAMDLANSGVAPEVVSDIMVKFSELLVRFRKAQSEFNRVSRSTANAGMKANFVIDRADEDEIKSLKNSDLSDEKIDNYDNLAQIIIDRFGYEDRDEIKVKRLKNIIIAKLRDVRDDLETSDSLKKSEKVGGMDFSDEQISRLLDVIESEKNQHKIVSAKLTESKIVFPVKKENANQSSSQPISLKEKLWTSSQLMKNTNEDKIFTGQAEENNLADNNLIVVPTPDQPIDLLGKIQNGWNNRSLIDTSFDKENIKEIDREIKPEIKMEGGLPVVKLPGDLMVKSQEKKLNPNEPLPAARPVVELTKNSYVPPKSLSNQSVRKPQMDDIKVVKKLIGPIEELEMMTLIDFRRLAVNPVGCIDKIRDRINLLESQSYGNKFKGVEAWKKNEVNRFYRLLGQKSIEESKSVEDIINERLKEGKPTLSLDEFHAIMELNRELRY